MLYTLHETGYYGATPLRLAALAVRRAGACCGPASERAPRAAAAPRPSRW